MRIAITGATGRVGYGIAAHLAQQGHRVIALARSQANIAGVDHVPFALNGPQPDLTGIDALVHAAFSHLPGRYRGGEGNDPDGFRRNNRDGTLRLFQHAQASGVGRIVFLSSRAVYDGYPAGTVLFETMPPSSGSLYGLVKADVEEAMAAMASEGLAVASLRATGVYGPSVPGHPHKWTDLFSAFDRGEELPARIGTEVHAEDVSAAVALLLKVAPRALEQPLFNASDIVLDHRDLLASYAALAGRAGRLPPRCDTSRVSAMNADRLQRLGWSPRGMAGLRQCLRDITR